MLVQRPQSALVTRDPRPRPRPLCPSLLHGLECNDRETCPASHDPRLIQRKRCGFGHPRSSLARGERNRVQTSTERYRAAWEKMKKGLYGGVVLNTAQKDGVTTAFGDWYGIRNTEVIASFNCLRGGGLAVPGLPPAFVRPTTFVHFGTKDKHLRNVPPWDEPEEEQPPKFQPLAQALRVRRPDMSLLSGFHIVTTAGCLRRLTNFLDGENHRDLDRTQRLDIEVREDTVFIGRWEGDWRNRMHTGYGKQFEELATSYDTLVPDLKDTLSSHVAMSYDMGDLKLVVQAEVDALCCKCHTASKGPWGAPPEDHSPPPKRRLSSGRFDVLSLDTGNGEGEEEEHYGAVTTAREGTKILHAGRQVDLSCCVEIKTRTEKAFHKPSWPDFMAQLYFQRTSKVFLALHRNGLFLPEEMWQWDVAKALSKWEAENQVLLARLVKLLEDVRSRAVEAAEKAGGQCRMALVLGREEQQAGGDGRRVTWDWKATLYEREGSDSMLPEEL